MASGIMDRDLLPDVPSPFIGVDVVEHGLEFGAVLEAGFFEAFF